MRRCLTSISVTNGKVSSCQPCCFLIIIFYFAPDIDECKAHIACQCDGCACKNNWGGYECKCKGNRIYIKEQDACIGKRTTPGSIEYEIVKSAISYYKFN